MVKKAILGALLVGLIGVLVAGAIIRTVDKTGHVAEARGQGRGQGVGETTTYAAANTASGRGGYGQGAGRNGTAERQFPNYENPPADWTTVQGTVVQAPGAGVDLVIKTDDGEEMIVGTGPGYMAEQGFVLQAGERVQVQGTWEDGEFKASLVTRLQDGQTIALRDQVGRPAWAGGGRGAGAVTSGGYGGKGNVEAPGEGTGIGQAEVDEWLTLPGEVLSASADALVVQTAQGEIVVDGQAWRFAQEQGFTAQAGDPVTLTGFYEDGEIEVGQMSNDASGQVVTIREEGGRPLWAGRGRRGGW